VIRFVPIGDCVVPVESRDPARDKPGGTFRYIDLSSVDKDRKVIETNLVQEIESQDAPSRARQLVSSGDILISTVRPNLNGIAIVADELDGATASTGYCVLRCNERLDPLYLYYWVQSPDFVSDMVRKATGANYPAVSDRVVKTSTIPLPSLATQKHIARVLEQVDQLGKQAQQMESELNQLAQSLFLEMFGDLFRNPKAWPIVELSGLITQGPKNGLYKHADDYGTGSPIVRIDNFYDGELTNHSTFKRVAATVAELDKFKIDENSILINRVNSREYLGKAALVERLQEPTVFESNMMNFSVDTDRINPLFLVTQLGSLYVKEQIRKASKDAVNQSSINQGKH